MKASPKRLSLPDTGSAWGSGGGLDRSVYPQPPPVQGRSLGPEEDPLLAANRHSLVEKIGELAASAHALGEGQFPFPFLPGEAASQLQAYTQYQPQPYLQYQPQSKPPPPLLS